MINTTIWAQQYVHNGKSVLTDEFLIDLLNKGEVKDTRIILDLISASLDGNPLRDFIMACATHGATDVARSIRNQNGQSFGDAETTLIHIAFREGTNAIMISIRDRSRNLKTIEILNHIKSFFGSNNHKQ